MDNLFNRGVVKSDIFSVSFEPTSKRFSKNGELTFGGTDHTKFTGSITYA
jgi:cathepsin E